MKIFKRRLAILLVFVFMFAQMPMQTLASMNFSNEPVQPLSVFGGGIISVSPNPIVITEGQTSLTLTVTTGSVSTVSDLGRPQGPHFVVLRDEWVNFITVTNGEYVPVSTPGHFRHLITDTESDTITIELQINPGAPLVFPSIGIQIWYYDQWGVYRPYPGTFVWIGTCPCPPDCCGCDCDYLNCHCCPGDICPGTCGDCFLCGNIEECDCGSGYCENCCGDCGDCVCVPGAPVRVEPTCTEPGSITIRCTLCDEVISIEVLDPLGHHWGEWFVYTPAECNFPGVERRNCLREGCDHFETRELAALNCVPGEWVVVTYPTCETAGRSELRCSRCNTLLEYEVIPALGHLWGEWFVVTEPVCGTDGLERRECLRAGCDHFETRAIPALHCVPGEWVVVTEATCETAGRSELRCSRCNTLLEYEIIPALGHLWGEWFVVTEPVCGTDGLERRECLRAGCDHFETRAIPALDCDPCPYCGECLVCSECLQFNFNIFNNGPLGDASTPNEGLANINTIRLWTQVSGENTNLAYPANVNAVIQGTTINAMEFVRIGRVWQDGTGWLDDFNLIDVRKTDAWEFIVLTIVPFGCHLPVTVLLHNGNFVAEYDVTFIVNVGAVNVFATYTRTIQVPRGELIPVELIPAYAARRGFYFAGWYLGMYPDWVPYHPAYFGPVNEALTFTARFNLLWHNITFVAGEGGTLQLEIGQRNPLPIRDGMLIAAGQVPTPVALPCHRFVEWRLEGVATNPVGFDATGNVTFVAIFEAYCSDLCPDCGECQVCSECLQFRWDMYNNGEGVDTNGYPSYPSRAHAGHATAGIIRMWTGFGPLNGGNRMIPFRTVTAVDQNGDCAMYFVINNPMWNPNTHMNMIDVRKAGGAWEYIWLTIIVCGEEYRALLINSQFTACYYCEDCGECQVCSECLDFRWNAFNNGQGQDSDGYDAYPSRPNSGLAAAGLIRMWTGFGPVENGNRMLPLRIAGTITAYDQDGVPAMGFVRVNQVWLDGTGWQNYFNFIDVDKDGGSWEYIWITIVVCGEEYRALLINTEFRPPEEYTFWLECRDRVQYPDVEVTVCNGRGDCAPACGDNHRHVRVYIEGTATGEVAITMNGLPFADHEVDVRVNHTLWTPGGPVPGIVVTVWGGRYIAADRTLVVEVTRNGVTRELTINLVACAPEENGCDCVACDYCTGNECDETCECDDCIPCYCENDYTLLITVNLFSFDNRDSLDLVLFTLLYNGEETVLAAELVYVYDYANGLKGRFAVTAPSPLNGELRISADWFSAEYTDVNNANGETVKLYLWGDVNANGMVDQEDVLLLSNYLLGLGSLTPEQRSRANVTGNDNLSDADLLLLQFIVFRLPGLLSMNAFDIASLMAIFQEFVGEYGQLQDFVTILDFDAA